jgi:superfamily I DNA/RNA helicase
MKTTLVLGGPGTGKTHNLLDKLEGALAEGIAPEQIAFVSFTRRAVVEAKERAMKRFGYTANQFPLFRTLHSLCYSRLGIRQGQILSKHHLVELGNLIGITLSGTEDEDIDMMAIGDRMLFMIGLHRAREVSLEQIWHECNDAVPWFQLLRLNCALEAFKQQRKLLDFADLLALFLKQGQDVGADLAFIDEAQDLTPIQWRVVKLAFAECAHLVVAGDDDQAIYAWAGADVEEFLSLSITEKEYLPLSRRVPQCIHNVATTLLRQILHRYDKPWLAKEGAKGSAESCRTVAGLDLTQGTWYLLARNRCFTRPFTEECERQGIVYSTRGGSSVYLDEITAITAYERLRKGRITGLSVREGTTLTRLLDKKMTISQISQATAPWFETLVGISTRRRSYYQSVLRRGGKLSAKPTVHIDTIHGVKGGEADNVLLSTDLTPRTELEAKRNADAEARVFYVGVTRAIQRLFLLTPQTSRSYTIRAFV